MAGGPFGVAPKLFSSSFLPILSRIIKVARFMVVLKALNMGPRAGEIGRKLELNNLGATPKGPPGISHNLWLPSDELTVPRIAEVESLPHESFSDWLGRLVREAHSSR
ncbi:hypothetical protein N7535_007646 [Penicillium sp. DV-2018c]|nr:hypothetical protein N7461_003676 [Penicillium sp. DV-2018c]KAJ5566008.1 hypothetical protein N7535_007646 [Penicillium sp. DV-2018c]